MSAWREAAVLIALLSAVGGLGCLGQVTRGETVDGGNIDVPRAEAGMADAAAMADAALDAQVVRTDAGSPPADAGSPPADAGSPPADAGSPPTDAGSPPVDAGSPPTDAGSPPMSDAGPPTGSTGCSRPPAGEGPLTVDVPGGGTRTYLVDLPDAYDQDIAYPLVFGFHGATTSGSRFAGTGYSNLVSTMGPHAILVYPDALPPGSSSAWDHERDLPFFDALLAHIKDGYCVDEDRVFATGHSSGAFFVNELGCDRGDVLRAIAPVSGGGPYVFGSRRCTGAVPTWIAHGTSDDTVMFSIGVASRNHWARANGCDTSSSTPTSPAPCVAYTCSAARLEWCEYAGAHEWPTFAPTGIWQFFNGL